MIIMNNSEQLFFYRNLNQCNAALAFPRPMKGTSKQKLYGKLDLEPLLVEERNRGNKGIEQIEE